MDRLERLRYAAQHYPALQGLRIVPFGVAFLIVATIQPGLQWFPTEPTASWNLDVPLLTLAGACLASFGLKGYYERAFGVHRPLPGEKSGAGTGAVLGLALAVMMFALRVGVMDVFWVAAFAVVFRTAPRLRWYYAVAILAFIVLAVIPAFGVGSFRAFFGQNSRFHYLMLGVVFLVCGLLDHRLLRELFRPPDQEAALVQSL